MAKFRVPVRVIVPASGVVEVEARNLLEACQKVQADIDENGFTRPLTATLTTPQSGKALVSRKLMM